MVIHTVGKLIHIQQFLCLGFKLSVSVAAACAVVVQRLSGAEGGYL